MSINIVKRERLEIKHKKLLDAYLKPLYDKGYDVLGTFKRTMSSAFPHINAYNFYLTSIEEYTGQFKSYFFTSQIYTIFKSVHRQPKRYGIVCRKSCGCIEMNFSIYSQKDIANYFKYAIMRCSTLNLEDRVFINFLDGE